MMKKSTNPFENEDEEAEPFFNAAQEEDDLKKLGEQRAAPLHFDNPFPDLEQPALRFNDRRTRQPSTEFFSPLESAMLDLHKSPSSNNRRTASFGLSSASGDDASIPSPLLPDEGSALLSKQHYEQQQGHQSEIPWRNYNAVTKGEQGTNSKKTRFAGASAFSSSDTNELTDGKNPTTGASTSLMSKKKRRASQNVQVQSSQSGRVGKVLTKLSDDNHHSDAEHDRVSVEYKYILLEDLGTASSWLILLLPYITFLIALVLESARSWHVASVGPLLATLPCLFNSTATATYYESPPPVPCYSEVLLDSTSSVSTVGSSGTVTGATAGGIRFLSGELDPLPVVATYLSGDVIFQNLSKAAVHTLEGGHIAASVTVWQKEFDAAGGWTVLFSTQSVGTTTRIPITCTRTNKKKRAHSDTRECHASKLVDVVLSTPEVASYHGGKLQVDVLYSVAGFNDSLQVDSTSETSRKKSVYESTDHLSDEEQLKLLLNIVESSSYTFEHTSLLSMTLDSWVRLLCSCCTLGFIIYWSCTMNVWNVKCCRRRKSNNFSWLSIWSLFPERKYIVVLLIALLLLQEPVLAAMYLFPSLGTTNKLHIVADASVGVAVQTVLFVYLCLFHGFRYHTAAMNKKRIEHQKKILHLRRAARYVQGAVEPKSPSEENISAYTRDFYDRHGDVDGLSDIAYLRLQNDPFSDEWADFLLLKLVMLAFGIFAVVGAAYCRFPSLAGKEGDQGVVLDADTVLRYRTAYVAFMGSEFFSQVVWILLILKATVDTGSLLKKEPFLSTRPVQLAYRILMAHFSLGFVALLIPTLIDLQRGSTHGTQSSLLLTGLQGGLKIGEQSGSQIETWTRVVHAVARKFPYSGTAATVGCGRILFATVSILITAFIFLPAHALEDDTSAHQGKRQEQRRLRQDKRSVIRLASDSRTWRIFPLPIRQTPTSSTGLQDDGFQLYKDLHSDNDMRHPGVISIGPYTPVFCLELAKWLNEAAWQAYYSPIEADSKQDLPSMNLAELGMQLEGVVYDESTDTQAYVSTNIRPQVDGPQDSVVVVAFRGTSSASNIQTDLRSKQVPLSDQLAGIGSASFCILPDRCKIYDDDGWIWDIEEPLTRQEHVQCVTSWSKGATACESTHLPRVEESTFDTVKNEARRMLQDAPLARGTFPLVHEGFQQVYTHIRRRILEILFPILQRQFARSLHGKGGSKEPLVLPKIYVTGHSLGGALAQLLALDLASNCQLVIPLKIPKGTPDAEVFNISSELTNGAELSSTGSEIRLQPPVAVYTFGQPRIGNKALSKLYKGRVPHTFRVVNEGDTITSLPNRLFCGGIYKHAGLEVLLDEGLTGNVLVGPTVVETLFRFHQVRTNIRAHGMERYRDSLECAFEEHELAEYYQGRNTTATLPDWMTQVRESQ